MSGGGCLDWPALMRAGLQGLALEPRVFWALSPAELLMMLGDGSGRAAMGRAQLDALVARFPDTTDEERTDGGDG